MRKLIIIAGPSGAGKTTISEYLRAKFDIPRVITHTTRPMRAGEQNGVDYYFETDESFAQLHFFEHVRYGSYQYGSSRESLEKSFAKHEIVSLIVETAGVQTYLKQLPQESVFIYLTVSDQKILGKRLVERGDAPEQIEKRLNSAEFKRDLSLNKFLTEHAHVKNNDVLETAQQQVDELILSLLNV